MTTNLFEQAVREAWTFESNIGLLDVVQLWKLEPTSNNPKSSSLNDVYARLQQKRDILQKNQTTRALPTANSNDPKQKELALLTQVDKQIELVLYINDQKILQTQTAIQNHEKRRKLDILLQEKAKRDDEQISKMSDEELLASINALKG